MVTPFYLAASAGHRLCLYHSPAKKCRGRILFAPPFGEELNKSRRMIAWQARTLAQSGFGVLLMDLYGTGDSAGEFSDATWSAWLDDLALGTSWLNQQGDTPLILWGFRLGVLLALEYSQHFSSTVNHHIFWQPVTDGERFMTQFLRLRLVNGLLSSGKPETSVSALRTTLAHQAEPLEIAGYPLSNNLLRDIDSKKMASLCPPSSCAVQWHEIMPSEGPLGPAARHVVQAWEKQGQVPTLLTAQGSLFWQTQEITDCPALIHQTLASILHEH